VSANQELTSIAEAFAAVSEELRGDFAPEVYKSWLEALSFAGLTEEATYLRAPTTVARDWIRQNAQHLIESRMSRLLESPVVIKVEASSQLPNGLRGTSLVGIRPSAGAPAPQAKAAPKATGPAASLQQTFDNYCVGESNRAAVNAARAIAEGNGREVFSLVLIAGAHGTGKSHLLSAIAAEAQKREPSRVRLMGSTLFVEQFMSVLRKKGDGDAFRAFVRDNRLLLIDDVQLLASKPASEGELVEALTAVIANGGQVVLAADQGPEGLAGFDVRLRNQLKSATVINIDMPDFELRRKILEAKVKQYGASVPTGFDIPTNVLDLMASRLRGPGRQLDAAIRQLVLELGLANQDVTMEAVERVLAGRFSEPERRPTVDLIIAHTAKYYGLSKEQLLARTHKRSIARPRQIVMYLCRKYTRRSFPDLANRLGGKHHTTILYGAERITELLAVDESLRRDVGEIEKNLRGAPSEAMTM
jgi:chromosomal replication initiator protein